MLYISALKQNMGKNIPEYAQWAYDLGIPIGTHLLKSVPYSIFDLDVKFDTLTWDPNYNAPEGGWYPIDRPPIRTCVKIDLAFYDVDAHTTNGMKSMVFGRPGRFVRFGKISSEVIFPHCRTNGSCFHPFGNPEIRTLQDFEVFKGRIARFLGGANLASLYSGWSIWGKELRDCIPPRIAEILQEYDDDTMIRAYSVKSSVPFDYTFEDYHEETWTDRDGIQTSEDF